MRVQAPGRFETPSDNNSFLLEKVTWTRMGRHGKTSDTEQWWMRRVTRSAGQTAPPPQGIHATTSLTAGAKSAAIRCQNSGDGVRFRASHW